MTGFGNSHATLAPSGKRTKSLTRKTTLVLLKRLIATQPIDTVRKVFVGLFTFLYEMTNLTNSLIPGSLALIGWALAIVGLRRANREERPSWLIWLPIVVMNVFVALLIPLGRYSVPILPCLMILAAFGVDTLLNRLNLEVRI
jgi:hypothetical protein